MDVTEPTRYVGIINKDSTCSINSLIQTFYMTPEFRNKIFQWNNQGDNEDEASKRFAYQLQSLFVNLQISKNKTIDKKDLTKLLVGNNNNRQHDVVEVLGKMFTLLKNENLINEFQGKVERIIKTFIKSRRLYL